MTTDRGSKTIRKWRGGYSRGPEARVFGSLGRQPRVSRLQIIFEGQNDSGFTFHKGKKTVV